jgi:hypothetical protein
MSLEDDLRFRPDFNQKLRSGSVCIPDYSEL